jgi:hypothetical protein
VIAEFSANRSASLEARLQQIEDHLAQFSTGVAQQLLQMGAGDDTTGGGIAAASASSGSGGGGGGSSTLSGDVTGTTGATVVERARNITLPTPVAADNHKVLAYTHGSLIYELLTPPFKVASTAIDLTLTVDHMVVLVDASGGDRTITLPAAAGATDRVYVIKKIDSDSTKNVVIDGNGAETIDGDATYTFYVPYSAVTVISNGTAWFIF